MFLENKYTQCYFRIIERAKSRILVDYSERHHIMPKSLGGSNTANNIVKLTAREHFIVHRLLVKMTTGKSKMKMSFAFFMFMSMKSNKMTCGRNPLVFSSRMYEESKRLIGQASSYFHKGKKVSDLSVQKRLATRRANAKPYPEATREIQRNLMKKRWENNYDKMVQPLRTQKFRDTISKANKGKNRMSEKQRTSLALANRGANNARARRICVIAPDGTCHECHGRFQQFCKDNGLPYSSMCHLLHKTKSFKKGATVGWQANFMD